MPSIEREGTRIAFTDEGEGPVVVLGHSFLCSGEMWAPQLPALTASYRVVNVDYRGHGASGPIAGRPDLWDLADDVLAVLDELAIERAAWVGLSIGGMVALRAALAAPHRVAGLVLLDTDAGAETLAGRLQHRALALGVRLLGIRPLLPVILPLFLGATTRKENPELARDWADRLAANDPRSVLRLLPAIDGRESLLDRLGEIAVPTAVAVGAEDRTLAATRSRDIARGIPGATLTIVPAAGHLANVERPEPVTATILDALAAIYPETGRP